MSTIAPRKAISFKSRRVHHALSDLIVIEQTRALLTIFGFAPGRGLNGRDGLVQLFVRQARDRVSVFELHLLRHQQGANLQIGRGCIRRTFATAFSPCLRKSRNSAQMTSSLSLFTRATQSSGRNAERDEKIWHNFRVL